MVTSTFFRIGGIFIKPKHSYIHNMKPKINYFFLTFFVFPLLISSISYSGNDAQRLFSLIDYIGGDYQFAVKDGEIINQDEYAEIPRCGAR